MVALIPLTSDLTRLHSTAGSRDPVTTWPHARCTRQYGRQSHAPRPMGTEQPGGARAGCRPYCTIPPWAQRSRTAAGQATVRSGSESRKLGPSAQGRCGPRRRSAPCGAARRCSPRRGARSSLGQRVVHPLDLPIGEPLEGCAEMQTFAAARRSGILLRVPAPGSTSHTSANPFGLDIATGPLEETIADLASAALAFSFVPPASAATGAKDLIPSQPVNPVAGPQRTFDFPDLSRALPVISGSPVVAGPSRNTIAASAAAAFAVGAVAMDGISRSVP